MRKISLEDLSFEIIVKNLVQMNSDSKSSFLWQHSFTKNSLIFGTTWLLVGFNVTENAKTVKWSMFSFGHDTWFILLWTVSVPEREKIFYQLFPKLCFLFFMFIKTKISKFFSFIMCQLTRTFCWVEFDYWFGNAGPGCYVTPEPGFQGLRSCSLPFPASLTFCKASDISTWINE